jgi:hypothetical protein
MPTRYCAIAMDVVADLDGGYVRAHIRTDTGKNITLICEGGRIPAIQSRIESLQHAFPGLIARTRAATVAALHDAGSGLLEPTIASLPPLAPAAA